ncbi:Microfibrillar-associated protein 1 [Armadillidium nasatum]|uniref:Microfibrillar-associated protein 1 n=1 Tax=Armadillidium nasatum TaxID=96803 RepID=A0A5N5T0H7_9CRUS|nr:Microfibrillar-associated protein 1 [Armadillidium nasatum]
MMDTTWTAPPGAAQPAGIQSTAGAVPIFNEKGELSMKKVKVQRYVSGKRPDYAPASSDEEETDDEDFTHPRAPAQPSSPPHKSLTEAELQDPRLRRLRAIKEMEELQAGEEKEEENEEESLPQRVIHEAEVIEMSDEEMDDDRKVPERDEFSRPSHRLAESDSESEDEVDEEELAQRRIRMRERAMQKVQEEDEVLGKEEEGSEESSEEESSEYTEESESEEENPRMKPIFVEVESKRRTEERRRETLRMIEQQNRQEQQQQHMLNGIDGEPNLNDVNTDDEADDAEYEAWKEERELMEKEKEEMEKLRNMTEDERRLELRNNPKVVTNKAVKGKYKFLQKYYHRGAFFLSEEQDVFKRDFSGATLDDHFDKTILPKVMQVKNFGRSGRTKYTHLVDQDTTSFDSPWASDTQMNHKFSNTFAGGMKQVFDRPTSKKRSTQTTTNSSTTRK